MSHMTRREFLQGMAHTAGALALESVPVRLPSAPVKEEGDEQKKHCDCPSKGWAVGGWCIPWNISPPPHKVYFPVVLD
jgi:hypothetical protein